MSSIFSRASNSYACSNKYLQLDTQWNKKETSYLLLSRAAWWMSSWSWYTKDTTTDRFLANTLSFEWLSGSGVYYLTYTQNARDMLRYILEFMLNSVAQNTVPVSSYTLLAEWWKGIQLFPAAFGSKRTSHLLAQIVVVISRRVMWSKRCISQLPTGLVHVRALLTSITTTNGTGRCGRY